jgi:hypothetical protein
MKEHQKLLDQGYNEQGDLKVYIYLRMRWPENHSPPSFCPGQKFDLQGNSTVRAKKMISSI